MDKQELIDYLSRSNNFICKDEIYYSKETIEKSYADDNHDVFFDVEDNSFWFQHRNKCIIPFAKSTKSLLFDVGGGNGCVAKALQVEGIETVLVEPGTHGVANAKKRKLNTIVCGTIQDMKELYGNMEAITLLDVLEHIEDDKAFAKEMYKALKEDGTLYLTVPAFQFLWSIDDIDAGHFRRYSIRGIKDLLRENGFEIEYASYFFSALLIPLFFARTLPSKLKLRKDVNKNVDSVHKNENGILSKGLNFLLNIELQQIRKRRYIPFGSSCLIIAKKTKHENSI